jgi:nucleoside phosphorylase
MSTVVFSGAAVDVAIHAFCGRLSSSQVRIPGERFDYSSELQRHEKFVGRTGLLARLDQLLASSGTDRWVVITGGPGMGKSALLAAWLARREAAGAVVPHHFIRRGAYDWDDPAKLVGSLVAQIGDRFPDQRERDADDRIHPATRLARALARVSANALRPRGERLVVLIDGLDEYDAPAGPSVGDPLAAFLPQALPAGVSLVCASRPRHPYVSSLEARDGELVQIDLDTADSATDNDATVRLLWGQTAGPLELDARFVDEAVTRAGGNVQHAVQLRKHLAVVPAAQRRVEDIPRGLAALIDRSWERLARDEVVVEGLGILCAAREALTLDELGAVAAWTGDLPRRTFARGARELLVETRRPGGQPEYRLHHDSIRGYIAQAIGDVALRRHHGALVLRLATWPPSTEPVARRYALRHALIHRVEAGDRTSAWQLAADTRFLEAKCRELGAHETEADVARVAERCRAIEDAEVARRFGDLGRALTRESHWLRTAPEATAALVWNRLRRSGWSASDLDGQLRVPAEAGFLRVRQAATRESPALVRDLPGHTDWVTACAVTADGRRVVSASEDGTLKVWELESGRALATLKGHTGRVTACAMTVDARRVVSASEDGTLKVWDLESGRALSILEGHTGTVNGCAVTADGRQVVSGSSDRTLKVWDLESGRALATLEGHTDRVWGCAVTPDGRRIVSGSSDRTLKVWDLESGRALATLEGHTDWGEARAIQVELERGGHRDRFELVTRWAAQPLDLLRELRKLKPTVVHFSGHGGLNTAKQPPSGQAPRRDVVVGGNDGDGDHVGHGNDPRHGLFFQSPEGDAQFVTAAALEQTFGAAGASVKLVVLNACYSDDQAEVLVAHVGCVVGMGGSITDDAARNFAIGFYGGLGEGESVAAAYQQGRAAISLEGLREADRPQLKARGGVDASQIILAADRPASTTAIPAADRPGSRPVIPTNERPASPTMVSAAAGSFARPKVDIGILTIRDDEFRALLDVFPTKAGRFKGLHREYDLRHADAGNGERYTVTVLRQAEQGTGEAQDVARDVIEDLAPRLVLVVGIAGGLPSDDVKLGDVILSTRIHDFTVEARKAGHKTTYAVTGGPIDKALAAAVTNLASRDDELGDWTTGLPSPPTVEWTRKGQLYGPPAWRRELRAKLEHHHGEASTRRAPVYVTGPIASSDRLVKDPALLFPWLAIARGIIAVEMESGGVFRAARERCPMLAIRGISDIVGLKRADAWTKFACASAAAFTRAFLRTRPVPLGASMVAPDPQ